MFNLDNISLVSKSCREGHWEALSVIILLFREVKTD